jgi:hypothetical protein
MPDETPITKLNGIPPWLAVHHTEQGEEAMLMKPTGDESVPIEESSIPLTEVFAEGVDRLEVVGGENLRLVFWRWQYRDGRWTRAGVDVAVILPMKAIPAELLGGIRIVRPPQRPALTVSVTRQ